MLAAPAGSVYLTEAFSGQVSKIDAGGQKTVIAKDLKMPEGVALAADGKLIVAEVGAKRIVEIDPATGSVTEIAGNLPIGLPGNPNIPTGVGVGASGTIYFVGRREHDLRDHEEVEQKSFQRDPLVSDGRISFGQTAKPSTRRK